MSDRFRYVNVQENLFNSNEIKSIVLLSTFLQMTYA